jgi:glutamine---fructose-6-phosphate transaminase (isomerizing)
MIVDRVEQFRSDLGDGPAALRRLHEAWVGERGLRERVPPLDGRPIRFTGLGSSRFAALVVAAELDGLGTRVPVDWASAPGPGSADEVLFAISSSGRTPEVVEAARSHAARGGTVVAVTTDESSALAGAATSTLPLLTTPESSGIACTTFRATVATLALAVGLPDRLASLATMLEDALAMPAAPHPAAIDGADAVDVIGVGRSIGALEQAALMLREGPRLRAHAWDAGDWLHVGVYTALPGHRAILFPGTRYDDEVTDTVRRRGGEVICLDPAKVVDPMTAAIVGLATVEALAAGIWSRAAATDL